MNTLKCFEDFKCVGGSCPDNCCIGWEIGIDKETLKKYKSPPLYDFVKDRVDFSRSVIKLEADGRCPFLNKDNLCDIIINYGYDSISYICKKHPSFINEYEGECEYGYGLCCDEALRLLYKGEVKLEHKGGTFLLDLRNSLFDIICDKKLPFHKKASLFLDKISRAEDVLFFGEELSVETEEETVKKETLLPFLEIIGKTEPISEEWTIRINKVKEKYSQIEKELEGIRENEKYIKLFYYYTFRYLLKDTEENTLMGNGKLILILVLINMIFDAYSLFSGDNFNNTRLISKQMEYSMENISLLIDEAMENEALEYEKIIGLCL
ncbi:MAG: hypothetical protein E7411_06935 [Ruminococcaceae bacterium]|nr:hypothetical protein [Oscillospiraceae bacterium]